MVHNNQRKASTFFSSGWKTLFYHMILSINPKSVLKIVWYHLYTLYKGYKLFIKLISTPRLISERKINIRKPKRAVYRYIANTYASATGVMEDIGVIWPKNLSISLIKPSMN